MWQIGMVPDPQVKGLRQAGKEDRVREHLHVRDLKMVEGMVKETGGNYVRVVKEYV